MTQVYRVDIGGGLKPPRETADGRLIVDGYLTRSGVFQYRDASGQVRMEWRPPEEVFSEDSLQSFAMAPVTDNHPSVELTAANMREHAVGSTGETVRKDGDHVAAPLVIYDAPTVAKVRGGKVELSCGYFADVEYTSGTTPDGIHYDAIQRNIRGNHVAIVDRGRAGPSAKIRMDAAVNSALMIIHTDTKENLMPATQALLDATTEATAQRLRADGLDTKVTAEVTRADEATARADKAEAERDAATARADKAEAERDAAVATLTKHDHSVLVERVAKVLITDGKPDDLTGKSAREIKAAAIERLASVTITADHSDEYVRVRFDEAIKDHAAGSSALATTLVAAGNAGTSKRDDARAAMQERNRNAHKSTPAN